MPKDRPWLKKLITYLTFFIFTFVLVYSVIHPVFRGKIGAFVALKTSFGTSIVFLIILYARKLTSKKNKAEIAAFRKEASLWTQISSQVILYLMVVLTVYSFVINLE